MTHIATNRTPIHPRHASTNHVVKTSYVEDIVQRHMVLPVDHGTIDRKTLNWPVVVLSFSWNVVAMVCRHHAHLVSSHTCRRVDGVYSPRLVDPREVINATCR